MAISEKEVQKLKRAFLDLDEDGSGEISLSELKAILSDPTLRMNDSAIEQLLKDFDKDGSGGIDVSEFIMWMGNRKNMAMKKKIHKAIIMKSPIRQAFRAFDTNGDGFISRKEFRQVMQKQKGRYFCIKEEQLDAMMAQYDKNGDGKIDYDEFVLGMTGGNQ